MFQSAPAIAGGRCTSGRQVAAKATKFQSAPAIAGGRCLRGPDHGLSLGRVSIRARHCWRAMRCRARRTEPPPCCFNPRPPLLAGDADGRSGRRRCRRCFNPRPPLLAGDARRLVGLCLAQQVSIRARHCWRAMRVTAGAGAGIGAGFNPRPPLLAGDASPSASSANATAVSIRARHCWRAMRRCPGSRWTGSCFNPRPPLLAGDAFRLDFSDTAHLVSIRARHCWRAMRHGL